jgi:hypothetical protein
VTADADPGAACHLVGYDDFRNSVRKEKLIVEATLTEFCIPVVFKAPYVISRVVRCRDSDTPNSILPPQFGASIRPTRRDFSDHSECQQTDRRQETLTGGVHALRSAFAAC